MRYAIIFSFVAYIISAANPADAKKKTDTLFLKKYISPSGARQVIYIEHDRSSNAYERIRIAGPDTISSKTYLEILAKEYNVKPTKHQLPAFTRNWIPLRLYKGKYYVYSPVDGDDHHWISITDSTLVQNTPSDGAYESALEKATVSNAGRKVEMIDPIEGKSSIIIHIIDAKKGIAVVEWSPASNYPKFQLMVDEQRIRNFPLVVNYAPDEKADEFIFDKVNFRKLLGRN